MSEDPWPLHLAWGCPRGGTEPVSCPHTLQAFHSQELLVSSSSPCPLPVLVPSSHTEASLSPNLGPTHLSGMQKGIPISPSAAFITTAALWGGGFDPHF